LNFSSNPAPSGGDALVKPLAGATALTAAAALTGHSGYKAAARPVSRMRPRLFYNGSGGAGDGSSLAALGDAHLLTSDLLSSRRNLRHLTAVDMPEAEEVVAPQGSLLLTDQNGQDKYQNEDNDADAANDAAADAQSPPRADGSRQHEQEQQQQQQHHQSFKSDADGVDEQNNSEQRRVASPLAPTIAADKLADGYYTEPTLEELRDFTAAELNAVENFVVGHADFGFVEWVHPVDVTELKLCDIVSFAACSVEVYGNKAPPPTGSKLNCEARITVFDCWPKDSLPVPGAAFDAAHERLVDKYEKKLKKASAQMSAQFVAYNREKGQWTFKVSNFSASETEA
jgi:hypothetical protein